jgi:hypothetical protein
VYCGGESKGKVISGNGGIHPLIFNLVISGGEGSASVSGHFTPEVRDGLFPESVWTL